MDLPPKLKIIQGLIGQRYIGNLNLEKNTASKTNQFEWAIKNEKFKSTSFNSLDRLNKIYLAYLYNFSLMTKFIQF